MVSLNYRDPRPIYEQIKDQLRRLILSGALEEREKLTSVRDLASKLSINPHTIQRAYRELEAEGYVYSLPGKGSFVAPRNQAAEERRVQLLKDLEEILEELKITDTDPGVIKGYVDKVFRREGGKEL